MDDVIEKLAKLNAKPITILEVKYESWGSLTSFKAEFEDRITIYYPPQNSTQYKLHCIYHELGHIYLESIQTASFQPDISEEVLKQIEGAISVSCRFLPNSPVELWVEEFAFEMSKKTRSSSFDDNPNPFL